MAQAATASLTLTLESHPSAIRQALSEVVALLGRQNLSHERIGSAELVLAEALNNIAEHAYDGRADGVIELRFHCDGPDLTCELIDRGRGIPGGQLPAGALPDLDTPRAQLPEGGYGWFLIQALTRHLNYARIGGENHLTFSM